MPYNNYQKYNNSYSPKKPVKSFMDLEIYQQALAASVAVANNLVNKEKSKKKKVEKPEEAVNLIKHNMLPCALGIPHLIAEAHSYRFGSGTDCLVLLEKTMVNCNKMMVYLEQVRDICQTGQEHGFFEELIKKYSYIRRKTLNLQRVWKKYIEHPDGNFKSGFNKQPL
ncbi:MAG: hypothetical protein Q7R92_00560 [bacterium]|nr:hypothetical protein [bacterium]